jgi:hypothetical protein
MPRRKIINFLFDSVYQVVTWVWIAVSISAFFYYASKQTGGGRGMVWSAVSLFCSILVMVSLIAKQHFSKPETKERPELWIDKTVMLPLEAGKPEKMLMLLKNRGSATAQNILVSGNHYIASSCFTGPLPFERAEGNVRGTLAPGAEITLVSDLVDRPLNGETIDGLNARANLMFHYGEVKYTDEGGRNYALPFCFMYEPSMPTVMRIAPTKYWPQSKDDKQANSENPN